MKKKLKHLGDQRLEVRLGRPTALSACAAMDVLTTGERNYPVRRANCVRVVVIFMSEWIVIQARLALFYTGP